MWARVPPLLLRPTAPPLALGLVVSASIIAAESVLVYLLKQAVPGNIFGVVFLLGVLVVATVWGFGLGAVTSFASAVVYVCFHRLQTGGSIVAISTENWVAITIFLIVALSTTTIAAVARSRAAEADLRRRQVEATHDQLQALVEQQAALRRVAILIARGASPPEVFDAVADELARYMNVVNAGLLRFEGDGTGYVLAVRYEPGITTMPVTGEHLPLGGEDIGALVLRTGRAARIDNHENISGPEAAHTRGGGIGSIVGVPIVVDGRLWGAAIVGSTSTEPMPSDTEARIADFADLVATAIANAATRAELQASRDELSVLVDQQSALRRVATLVARGALPSEVFESVAMELAGLLGVENASVWRYESNGVATLLSAWDEPGAKKMPVGQRFSLEGDNIAAMVLQTGCPVRMDSHDDAAGAAAAQIRARGIRGGVGTPIIVDGRLWGVAAVGSSRPEPLPPDTEERVGDFADLAATAIANAQTHAELTASRVRIVTAADDARRRIERDLHDGAQQRLVTLGLELRTAEAHVPPEQQPLRERISQLVTSVVGVSNDLQELSRGIHPAILSKGGLGPALKTLARRSVVPVELILGADRRLPEPVEVAAYYVVAEALTNAAKYARASVVNVRLDIEGATMHLSIRDDGIGGADAGKGSGIIGLTDRVEAIGGKMTISSHPGSGTSLLVTIPLEVQ
jgi:signal transduction histidine kinase